MDKKVWEDPWSEKKLDIAQTPLWFWNDKLEENELVRQMILKTKDGIKSSIPHGRLNVGEGYIGGYLDEDWFEKIETVLKYKKKNDEKMWLYDEMDWPAGTCNKTITLDEKNREQYLSFQKIQVKQGKKFRAQIRDLQGRNIEKVKNFEELTKYDLNIFIVEAENRNIIKIDDFVLYSYIGPAIDFLAEKDSYVYIVNVRVDRYEDWGSGCVNYLDEKVTEKFIQSTYEKYYEKFASEFGKTIPYVFNDEVRLANAFPWTNSLSEEFVSKKGYSLTENLVELVLETDRGGRLRCDYFDVLAEMLKENFFGKISRWCSIRKLGFYAHLLGEETIASQARFSGDYMRQMEHMDIVGVDHLGKGIGSLNIKYAVSAARSYGKNRIGVEVFAGCGWDMTFEEYIRIITWMFQQGANIIINHGFFYSDRGDRKNDWPPSQFFQWSGFDKMKDGNGMVRRLFHALADGIQETEVLIYNPIESFWFEYLPNEFYKHGYKYGPMIENDKASKINKDMQILFNRLSEENIDFEILHKDACKNFTSEGKVIKNILNNQKFEVLILPMCKILPLNVIQLAEKLVTSGGKVITIGDFAEFGLSESEDKKVRRIAKEIKQKDNLVKETMGNIEKIFSEIKNTLNLPMKIVSKNSKNLNNHISYEDYLMDPYLHNGEELSGVKFVRYIEKNIRKTFFMNYDENHKTIEVEFNSELTPEVWDPFKGEIRTPEIINHQGNEYKIKINLPSNYGIILVSSKEIN